MSSQSNDENGSKVEWSTVNSSPKRKEPQNASKDTDQKRDLENSDQPECVI